MCTHKKIIIMNTQNNGRTLKVLYFIITLLKSYYTRMDMCSYASFNELKDLQMEYIHKYWNMFEVK